MNRRQLNTLSGMALAGGLLLACTLLETDPSLIYNPTESAEPGWYQVLPGKGLASGDLVAARLPEPARKLADARGFLPAGLPVIKTIAAAGGDIACWSNGAVSLPGAQRLELLTHDRAGRPLPRPPNGCVTLGPEEVFLASDRIPGSFDSRYFGAVDAGLVIGLVTRVARFTGGDAGTAIAGKDTGRGAGYCKIKARSAEEGPEPCLHIDFNGTNLHAAALHFDPYALYPQAFSQRCFTHAPCTSQAGR